MKGPQSDSCPRGQFKPLQARVQGAKRFIAGLGWALLLVSGLAQASELNTLAAQAMELSGTREMLEEMGKSLDLQVASDPRVQKMDKKQRAELTGILKEALDGRRMATELTAALAATNDAARLREAVAVMGAPLFQKVTRQTLPESLKATDQEVIKFAKGFQKRPPDPERIRLMQRLDVATDGSAMLADIRYESAAQFLAGVQMPDREARLAQLRASAEAAAPEEFLVRNLYIFRKVPAKDLEAYVAAHENEAMGWLARQVGYGMRDLIVASTGRMVAAILDVTAKKR